MGMCDFFLKRSEKSDFSPKNTGEASIYGTLRCFVIIFSSMSWGTMAKKINDSTARFLPFWMV